MPRTYLIFGDIAGKLDVLNVECSNCARKGNMSKWLSDLKGDCPKRDAHSLHERCDLLCPDLPKVL
jgi:hypothetical protein